MYNGKNCVIPEEINHIISEKPWLSTWYLFVCHIAFVYLFFMCFQKLPNKSLSIVLMLIVILGLCQIWLCQVKNVVSCLASQYNFQWVLIWNYYSAEISKTIHSPFLSARSNSCKITQPLINPYSIYIRYRDCLANKLKFHKYYLLCSTILLWI